MNFAISNTTPTTASTYNFSTSGAGSFATKAATALGTDSMDIGGIGGMVGHGIGGGVAAFFQAKNVASAFSTARQAAVAGRAAKAAEAGAKIGFMTKISGGVKGILGGFRAAMPSILKGTGMGAAVSGVISAGINGYRALVTKEISGRQAMGEIAADTVTGAVTSLGGLGLGAAVVGIAGTMLGGLPLAILGTAAGIAGSLLTDRILNKTGIRDGIRDAVAGGSTTTSTGTGTGTGTGNGGVVTPPPTSGDF
jgi:hypothetical protein